MEAQTTETFKEALLEVIKHIVDRPDDVSAWVQPEQTKVTIFVDTKGQNRFLVGKNGVIAASLVALVSAWSGRIRATIHLILTEPEGGGYEHLSDGRSSRP